VTDHEAAFVRIGGHYFKRTTGFQRPAQVVLRPVNLDDYRRLGQPRTNALGYLQAGGTHRKGVSRTVGKNKIDRICHEKRVPVGRLMAAKDRARAGYRHVMEPIEIARKLAGDGRVVEVGSGVGRLYRVWDGTDTHLVKIYSSVSAERREQQAFENLSDLPGLPQVVNRGVEDGTAWVMFAEPGKWNLASLPESLSLGRKAGELLAALHRHESSHLSNVAHGMDEAWIQADYPSTFKKLERYRGRVHLSGEVVEAALNLNPPATSAQVIIHTDPNPEQFLVDDGGRVTLFHWEWSTLGPPEWDYSRLLWLTRLRAGPDSATGVAEGYGRDMPEEELLRWSVYHSGMMLNQAVEVADQQLRGADWLVNELTRTVALLS